MIEPASTLPTPFPEPGERQPGGSLGRQRFWVVLALIATGGGMPLVLYGLSFGRLATVTPLQAKAWLRGGDPFAVLVDVRPAVAFAAGHIEGAVNWPLEEVLAVEAAGEVPVTLRGRTLLLVCDVGLASAAAVARLQAVGVDRVFHVRGGIQEWIRSVAYACGPPPPGTLPWPPRSVPPISESFDRWQVGPNEIMELPFRPSPVREQAAAVLAFVVVKPVYTLLALLIVGLLWKASAPDLAALRWGFLFFFLGENACAANYLLFGETSYLLEYLHSLGMLLSLGFLTFAGCEGLDCRLFHVTSPRRHCAALSLCGDCVKQQAVSCGLQRVFCLILPALMVVTLMLPTADWQDSSYNTWVFGRLYNYAHLRVYQQFENWYCPAAALVLLASSLAIVVVRGYAGMYWAKILFAGGAGALGFGLFRMILGAAYAQQRVWYLVWEEGTELLGILGILGVLLIYRRGLKLSAGC